MARESQRGFVLIEILACIALLAIIVTGFLGALGVSSKIVIFTDERETAKNIAEMQMEYIKGSPYATSYTPLALTSDYSTYSVLTSGGCIYAQDIAGRTDAKIQKIIVTIQRDSREIYTLVDYKAQ